MSRRDSTPTQLVLYHGNETVRRVQANVVAWKAAIITARPKGRSELARTESMSLPRAVANEIERLATPTSGIASKNGASEALHFV